MSVEIVKSVIANLATEIFFRSTIREAVHLPSNEIDFALSEIVADGSIICYASIDGPFRKLRT